MLQCEAAVEHHWRAPRDPDGHVCGDVARVRDGRVQPERRGAMGQQRGGRAATKRAADELCAFGIDGERVRDQPARVLGRAATH